MKKSLKSILFPCLALLSLSISGCGTTDTSSNPTSSSESVKVSYNENVTISIKEENPQCYKGGSITLSATIRGTTNRSVMWSSADDNIATVDGNGVVRGVSVGSVIITAKSEENPNKTASVTVTVIEGLKLNSITIVNGSEFNVYQGDENVLKISTDPAEGVANDVTWTVEDPTVASIENNLLTVLKLDATTKITATSTYDNTVSASAIIHTKKHAFNRGGSAFNYSFMDDQEEPRLIANNADNPDSFTCAEFNVEAATTYYFSVDVEFNRTIQDQSKWWCFAGIGNCTSWSGNRNIFALRCKGLGTLFEKDTFTEADATTRKNAKQCINIQINGDTDWQWGNAKQYNAENHLEKEGTEFNPAGPNKFFTIRIENDIYYGINDVVFGKMTDLYNETYDGVATKPCVVAAMAQVKFTNWEYETIISSDVQGIIDTYNDSQDF